MLLPIYPEFLAARTLTASDSNSASGPYRGSAAQRAGHEAASLILQLRGVTKFYATQSEPVRALDDVSLEAGAGRFVAVGGRSGCGKSTLLHLAGAMDFPSGGEVLVDGVATNQLNEAQLTRLRREKVGFVFQSFELLHTLSVVENAELPLLLAGRADPRALAMRQLEAVGLAELADRMPHQLSGGQMQRVAIARALVHEPRLLLADEPTGNLDSATGNAVLELLQRICSEQKTTIVMATHSAESTSVADTVVRMRDGRIEEVVHR